LTDRVGCGRSVMGFLLGELTDRGLVTVDRKPAADGKPDGGRPSHRVAVSHDAPVVIAAQLTADTIRVATVALGGRILSREEKAFAPKRRVAAVVDDLCSLIAAAAAEGPDVLGIGVGVPSPVRREDGYVFAALHLDWPGIPLRELMLERLTDWPGTAGVRLAIGNDANLAALAESRHGAGRGARQMLYLMTSRLGLGGALISDQELFTGAHGYAIEPGHVTVNPGGAPCLCGSNGCLEVEADHRALLRAAGEAEVSTERVVARVHALLERAREGERPALEALREVNAQLGIGLASLINLTDPDCVVLGDTLGTLLELEPDPITERVAERSFLNPTGAIPIRPGALQDATLLGAAELAFGPLLLNPREVVAKPVA
jgi:predicted NBD/HSP70 family sugar kinase